MGGFTARRPTMLENPSRREMMGLALGLLGVPGLGGKPHTDYEYASVKDHFLALPYLNGEPVALCQAANAVEGWVDVFVSDENGKPLCPDGWNPVLKRLYGTVYILRGTPENYRDYWLKRRCEKGGRHHFKQEGEHTYRCCKCRDLHSSSKVSLLS
jgi:hypothetical protein